MMDGSTRLALLAGAAIFLGMMAAAWITLEAFFLEAVLLWFVVRRAYPVPYEWSRIAKIGVACAIVLFVGLFTGLNAAWERALILLAFPVLLFVLRFPDERERFHLRRFLPAG